MKTLHKMLTTVPGEFEERETTPGGIKTKLLPHQKSGLNRMVLLENGDYKGSLRKLFPEKKIVTKILFIRRDCW